jgi:glycine/D-amino acid oxidase-like deaminating enzyme
MRVCVVGGGLAGALLTWRLAESGAAVEVVTGPARPADATAASGGAVRAYESDAGQRRLAADSLAELLASPTLQNWSGYRPGQCTYLHDGGAAPDVADIDGAHLLSAAELTREGWAGLRGTEVAVVETWAGNIDPDRLRAALLRDAASRPGVQVREETLPAIEVDRYDRVVVAAGPWTPGLLRASGWPGDRYRTKSIQYAVYPATGWPPSAIVDTTGMYGIPMVDGVLIGLATDRWDVDPASPPYSATWQAEAVRLARSRFPELRLGPASRQVGAVDCYADGPGLALRSVAGSVFTFTGGAGGSAKTALAASRRAAAELTGAA